MVSRPVAALLASALFATTTASAQNIQQPSYPSSFDEPYPLYEVLGGFTRPITTASVEAQAYFDQGVKLIYAFTLQNAARSFREAQKRDPNCAMCWFGEAWAWGPYLNGAMQSANAPRAYFAIQKAVSLREAVTPVERALIDAMAVRYEPEHDADRRVKLDTLYSEAMAKVYAQYPNDLDVGTLYAESVMLLDRRRGTYEIDQPHVQKIHDILAQVLARDVHHPGACHLYVHATEATRRADLAEECALHLGNSIPGASHINHMPSHTFNRIGRWGDAVRANIQAWHTDQRAEDGEGIAIGPTHNLHMLLYAAAYDGQGAVSIQAAKDYGKLISNGSAYYEVLTLVRFGRFDEVLAKDPSGVSGSARAYWDFARGYSHLKLDAADSARHYLEQVESAGRSTGRGAGGGASRTANLLSILGGILRGELLLSEGKAAEAIAVLDSAVAVETDMPYAEPEPLPFSARHWLGAALLAANRAADAERVYRDDLIAHPRNGWSLFGLAQSLDAQGKAADAAAVRKQFEESWVRSDTWLRASRY